MSTKGLTINEIARIPFFNDLSDAELSILSQMLEIHYYDENKYIFREGETQDAMFFIMEGSVKVLKNLENGEEETLALLKAPQVIGEMALVSPGTRSASIMSISLLVITRFSCASFAKIININPVMAVKILRKVADTVCTRLKKSNLNYIRAVHEPK